MLCFTLFATSLFPAPPDKIAEKPAVKKSAFDKLTFAAYVRHLNVWGPQIAVEIGDPKPSDMPGFSLVNVHASANGASLDLPYYISKDGQKIVQGSVYDISQNPFKADLDKLKTDLQPSFGTPGAPVVLVEFSDFECPVCREEAKTLRDNLASAYPKQVRLYFIAFPLDPIHPWARAAAIAGRCIFRQNANAFWDFHDWIFAHQEEINPENLKDKVLEFAKGKQLDVLQLTRCMDHKETEAEVNQGQALGKEVGVAATPTLFINGRKLVGRVDWPSLRNIIDYEIEYQKTAHNAGEDCGCEVALPAPQLTATIEKAPNGTGLAPGATPSAEALGATGKQDEAEIAAWKSAQGTGTPAAFMDFYRKFPHSPHIKTMTGTLRGRYWHKIDSPFGGDNQHRDGVLVTVAGMNVVMNLSLEDAKRLKVINSGPPGLEVKAQGTTFNYTYVEVTGGGIAVGKETISPRDNLNSTIVLSADGTRLLTWDLRTATPAAQPWPQPTMVKGSAGRYPCDLACP